MPFSRCVDPNLSLLLYPKERRVSYARVYACKCSTLKVCSYLLLFVVGVQHPGSFKVASASSTDWSPFVEIRYESMQGCTAVLSSRATILQFIVIRASFMLLKTIPGHLIQYNQSRCAAKAVLQVSSPRLVCSLCSPGLEIPWSFGGLSTACGDLWQFN